MQPDCPKCGAALAWTGREEKQAFSHYDGDMVHVGYVRDGLEWWCEECERFYRPSECEPAPAEKADEVTNG